MADIGVRSGKVQKGLYTCGLYVIEKQKSGWWYIWKDFCNQNKKYVGQKDTLADAYNWCRGRGANAPKPFK